MRQLLVLTLASAVVGRGDSKPDDPTIKAARRCEYPGGGIMPSMWQASGR
jgi:hypothetical protein